MQRVYNFSAGPATLPLEVLERAQRDLVCMPGWGMSLLEISHRDPRFVAIMDETVARLGRLLGIPQTHQVLFLQGGSRLQFSMVAMNLMGDPFAPAEYLVTGTWGKNAATEAMKAGQIKTLWDGAASDYSQLPAQAELAADENAAYVHYTSNETIQGVQFGEVPACGNAPLVCDASSDFLSRPIPLDRLGVIYACAQKNAGPAGVTVVIIRKDLLDRSDDQLPGYLNYAAHAQANSLWNTPSTFGIYMVGLVAQWLEESVGGLDEIHRQNRTKAEMLYEVIDSSNGFYQGHSAIGCRSNMNVTFRLRSVDSEQGFLSGAEERDLVNLKGHRSVGGIRASVYNAMPLEGAERLATWMREFAQC